MMRRPAAAVSSSTNRMIEIHLLYFLMALTSLIIDIAHHLSLLESYRRECDSDMILDRKKRGPVPGPA